MLLQLQVRNFVLIRELCFRPGNGLIILTGETGAGKSVLMGALSLISGQRADIRSVVSDDKKCILEAEFDIQKHSQAQEWLKNNELDGMHPLLIRRELSGSGKSRAFINDTPVTLEQLSELSSLLFDLHRQFDTRELQQKASHLQLLDEMMQLDTKVELYRQAYRKWKKLEADSKLARMKFEKMQEELDYHQFLLSELDEFQPRAGEQDELETEYNRLSQHDLLKSVLEESVFRLSEQDESVLSALRLVQQRLQQIQHQPEIEHIALRLNTLQIELKEMVNDLEHLLGRSEPDPRRMQLIQDRLNEVNRLLKKHHVQSDTELVQIQVDLSEKMHYSGQLETETHQLEKECEEAFLEASQLAEELSEQRKGGSEAIEKNLKDLLHRVGLPNASIQIEWTSTELHSSGKDKADILFDANKTGRYGSISKIASGGELSRIMLCLKSMLAGSASLPTLIFDEIDTGISGETAIQVGRILKELSEKHQLICITHLPQIAGMADQHFYIYKEAEPQGEMHTSLRLLNEDERVNTLAEMLSGKASGERERDMVRQILKSR